MMLLKNSQNSYDNKEFRFDSWDVRVYGNLDPILKIILPSRLLFVLMKSFFLIFYQIN